MAARQGAPWQGAARLESGGAAHRRQREAEGEEAQARPRGSHLLAQRAQARRQTRGVGTPGREPRKRHHDERLRAHLVRVRVRRTLTLTLTLTLSLTLTLTPTLTW